MVCMANPRFFSAQCESTIGLKAFPAIYSLWAEHAICRNGTCVGRITLHSPTTRARPNWHLKIVIYELLCYIAMYKIWRFQWFMFLLSYMYFFKVFWAVFPMWRTRHSLESGGCFHLSSRYISPPLHPTS